MNNWIEKRILEKMETMDYEDRLKLEQLMYEMKVSGFTWTQVYLLATIIWVTKSLIKNMLAVGFVALLFTLLGADVTAYHFWVTVGLSVSFDFFLGGK